MKHILGAIVISAGLAACTAAEMKEMEASDAMEAKANNYCSVVKGYGMDPKTLAECKEHYIQGLKDAAKK